METWCNTHFPEREGNGGLRRSQSDDGLDRPPPRRSRSGSTGSLPTPQELEDKKREAGKEIVGTMRAQLQTFVGEGDISDKAFTKYAQQTTELVLRSSAANTLAKQRGYREMQIIAVAAFAIFGIVPGLLVGLGCAAVSKAKRNTWAFWETESSVKAHEVADEMNANARQIRCTG